MATKITMQIEPLEIIEAIKSMNKKERDEFIEELLAASSPEYLSSIREARADYSTGRTKSHDEVFKK